jgi:hypothetical protein
MIKSLEKLKNFLNCGDNSSNFSFGSTSQLFYDKIKANRARGNSLHFFPSAKLESNKEMKREKDIYSLSNTESINKRGNPIHENNSNIADDDSFFDSYSQVIDSFDSDSSSSTTTINTEKGNTKIFKKPVGINPKNYSLIPFPPSNKILSSHFSYFRNNGDLDNCENSSSTIVSEKEIIPSEHSSFRKRNSDVLQISESPIISNSNNNHNSVTLNYPKSELFPFIEKNKEIEISSNDEYK